MALFVDVDDTNIPAKQTQSQVMDHAYAEDDQLVLSFPVSFVSADLNIQFGSFGLSNDGNSVHEHSHNDAKSECGSDVKSHEPVLIDLQEIVSCEGVDDINDDQTGPRSKDERRTNTSVYNESFDAAARQLDESKTQQIGHVQPALVKNATAIKNIDRRISKLERMIAHKTVCLKDKKQFIQEIKQLKRIRVHHLAADEFESASNQKAGIEEHQKVESFMDTDEQFWEDCIDELFHVAPYEIKIVKEELESISAVTSLETENTVKEEHAYDQNKADLFEEFGHVLENETDIEEIEAKLNEEILLEKNMKENETREMNKRNDEKARTLAKIQAQKTAQREKRRIKRLRKKEKQRAGRDAAGSSKSKRAWGSMVITVMVVALSILSFTNADLPKLVSSQH